MALNELLSTSFLFSVAIVIILIGGIFAYVSYRMSEQDHKITSMVGLISTMAEELQFFRSKLSQGQGQDQVQQGGLQEQPVTDQRHTLPVLDPNNLITGATTLIPVSDDEDESDEESIAEEDEDDDKDEDEDEDEDSASEDDDKDEDEDSASEDEDGEYDLDEIVDLEVPIQISSISMDEKINETNHSDIKSIHLEEPIELNVFEHSHDLEHDHELEHVEDLLASDLKTISITDLEDTNKKTDYKKMSITKLREVVIEKGIVADATKLKKNEILKLLGDE